MHKIEVRWHETSSYVYSGYRVSTHCDVVKSNRWVGMFQELADALKFANWKGIELGVGVELSSDIERILNPIKKEIKKGKKKKKEKKK